MFLHCYHYKGGRSLLEEDGKMGDCSLGNYGQLNSICLHMFVSNAPGAEIYVGSLKFCELIENGIVSGVMSNAQEICAVFCTRSPVL